MSKKWVISDLHLGHRNILKYSGPLRGGSTSEEHDAWLIDQINSVLKKNDLLYILGDIAFDYESLKLMNKIKCQKTIGLRVQNKKGGDFNSRPSTHNPKIN